MPAVAIRRTLRLEGGIEGHEPLRAPYRMAYAVVGKTAPWQLSADDWAAIKRRINADRLAIELGVGFHVFTGETRWFRQYDIYTEYTQPIHTVVGQKGTLNLIFTDGADREGEKREEA